MSLLRDNVIIGWQLVWVLILVILILEWVLGYLANLCSKRVQESFR